MFIIIETAIEYFYVSDTDLFLSLMKNIKALSRDLSEEKPFLNAESFSDSPTAGVYHCLLFCV